MSSIFQPIKSILQNVGRVIPSGRALPPSPYYEEAKVVLAPPDRSMLVLDCSGSMANTDLSPTRLDGAKAASTEFLRNRHGANHKARVGIVGFSDLGVLACPLVPVEPPDVFLFVLTQLRTVMGTNLAAGLETALQELKREAGTSLAACELVVLTDGHTANADGALAAAEGAKRLGCVVHVVGVGGNPAAVNEQLLVSIASKDVEGRSLYRFISDRGRLVRHFGIIGRGITR